MTVQVPIADRVIREQDYKWLHSELGRIGMQFDSQGVTGIQGVLHALSWDLTTKFQPVTVAHDQQQNAVKRAIALLNRSGSDSDERFHQYANKQALAMLTEYWPSACEG